MGEVRLKDQSALRYLATLTLLYYLILPSLRIAPSPCRCLPQQSSAAYDDCCSSSLITFV